MSNPIKIDEVRFFSWLSLLLKSGEFDIVITVERKATAILRALLDLTPEIKCDWKWKDVLSSDALPFLPKNWFKNKRILIFNEMIHHGSSTLNTIKVIEHNTPGASSNTKTASFVVHEAFKDDYCWLTKDFRNEPEALTPDYALERYVSDELYKTYRERFISILREKGALLLDTEHLESSFKCDLPVSIFLDALWTFGEPVEYEDDSNSGFPGVTIRFPIIADSHKLSQVLPFGIDLDVREPQKIRLLRRGPREFVFIPIWYPPLPNKKITLDRWKNIPSYIKPALDECPPENRLNLSFHLISLVTAVELLRSIWAGLSPFVGKGIEPDTLKGSEGALAPLGHLRALYPFIDFSTLEETLGSAISEYKNKTLSKLIHKNAKWQNLRKTRASKSRTVIDIKTRREKCLEVLTDIVKIPNRYSIGEDWFEEKTTYPCKGRQKFSWAKIWDTGDKLGISEPLRSVIMDTAIDNAFLKTGQMTMPYKDGSYIVRAYEIDSEYVNEILERLAHGAEEIV